MSGEADLARLVRFYETLSQRTLRAEIGKVYAERARFKDPFNDVQGLAPIAAIFEHMFGQVQDPVFVVTGSVMQGSQAFLTWHFLFVMKRFSSEPQCIRGATHVVFDADGLVIEHRDYWDAAEELYEKLPLLGSLMRWLKRAAAR
jgi:steroid delta-isomerase